jgi:membrane-associated phospholipid phosphatase
MRKFFCWFTGLLSTTMAVIVSYLWLDRPIALFVHQATRGSTRDAFVPLTQIPDPLVSLAVIVIVTIGLRALTNHSLSKHETAAFLCSGSVIVAAAIKERLKFIFGRTSPESWPLKSDPSFIRDGTYGFNFMLGGEAFQSFPSGHMAIACAIVSVIWIWYPQLRWPCAIAIVAVGVALVGENFHFLSDVIAGAFVGISAGWLTTAIWRAGLASK